MMSTAPSSSARSAVDVPSPTSPEQTMTGMGSSAMILRRNVMPSMRGISRSSTITSGRRCFILSMAISGSAATLVEKSPCGWRSEVIACRTTAESSTTRTCSCLGGIDGGDDEPRPVGHAAQALGMPDEEIARRMEVGQHPLDHAQARLRREVDQDIPAEDEVEGLGERV